MANIGQAALTIAGFAIGSLVSFPQLGFIVGSLLGGALFPTKLPGASGPRLSDTRTTTAQMGGPVMEVFGTDAVPGNVMWMAALQEVSNTDEVGGKGAPSQKITTYSYFQSIAVGICRGPMGGLLRIWENGTLVYDARPQQDGEATADYDKRVTAANAYAEGFELYLGDETQLPSPTIELDKGVGNTPAFRGLMYIVYPLRQLKEEQALRHPNFKMEVSQDIASSIVYSTDVLEEWTSDTTDPRNQAVEPLQGYQYRYRFAVGGAGPWRNALALAIVDGQAADTPTGGYNFKMGFTFAESGLTFAESKLSPAYNRDPSILEMLVITLHYNRYESANPLQGTVLQTSGDVACGAFPSFTPPTIVGPSTRYWWSALYEWIGVPGVISLVGDSSGVWRLDTAINVQAGEGVSNNCSGLGPSMAALFSPDRFIDVLRIPHKPEGDWIAVTGSFKTLQNYAADALHVTAYPLNPTIVSGSSDDTQAFWEAAYALAVTDGKMPSGLVWGVDYPVAVTDVWQGTQSVIGGPVALADVVRPICMRAGMQSADIEVTDLEDDYIHGYTITRVMAAKDALDPLRQVGLFDIIEGAQLKFRQRGGPVNRRLLQSELGAGEIDSDPGAAIKITYADETTLPRIIRLHYKAPSRDYEDGEQISPARSTTTANNDLDVEVAVSMSDDMAAQTAQILWADAWESAISYEISLDQYHVDLEPGDVLEVPLDGFYERARILDIDEAIPMLRTLKLARDYDGSFVSDAVADEPERTPGVMRIYGQSLAILLDIPALRLEDNDAGIYYTVRPVDPDTTWRSAALYRSTDGGFTFSDFGAVSSEPTTATVINALVPSQWYTWDDTQTLDVELVTGSLESRSEADVLAGANALAVGAAGRWEIVQFTTVQQIAPTQYRLSHLLRGRLGTEMVGTGDVGDMAVLVSGAGIVRAPLTEADIGLSSIVKAVTSGMSFADGTDQTFVAAGIALKPFAPVDIQIDVAVDTTVTWTRRDRLYQTLQGGALPMSEATEEYDIEIVDVGGTVLESATVATPEYIISPTLPLGYEIRVYQISAAVGRGSVGVQDMTTPIYDMAELTGNQDQPEVIINRDLRILEALANIVVLDRVAVLPGSPSDGQRYLLTADTGGGFNGQVAIYSGGWIFKTPIDGWLAWVADERLFYQYGAGSPSTWAIWNTAGGAISGISVSNQGSPGDTVPLATAILFSGAEVTDLGGGIVMVTIQAAAAGGLTDAPSDTLYYARKDGAWVAVDAPGGRNTVTAVTNSAGTVTLDASLGDLFTHTMTANVTTLSFANLPGAGKGATLMLRITQDSTPRTFAWPASFKWAGAAAGSISTASGKVDVLAMTTFDNGTTWDVTLAKDFG